MALSYRLTAKTELTPQRLCEVKIVQTGLNFNAKRHRGLGDGGRVGGAHPRPCSDSGGLPANNGQPACPASVSEDQQYRKA
eukprot:642831-Pleurochrysis_carterae.AAC.2